MMPLHSSPLFSALLHILDRGKWIDAAKRRERRVAEKKGVFLYENFIHIPPLSLLPHHSTLWELVHKV
jgi:hypothetical protein